MTDKVDIVVWLFEKLPHWGPELKRQFASRSVLVRECRSVSDLTAGRGDDGRSIVVLDLDADPAGCLAWLARRFRAATHCPVIVIASAELADLEWLIREAGAAEFVDDLIPGHQLARLCWRLDSDQSSRQVRIAGPVWR